jgi:hypothetical protein
MRQIRLHTRARYRGLPVAIVLREGRRDLVAVAGAGTPQEIALATIYEDPRTPRRPYRVDGHRRKLPTLQDAAEVAAAQCEALDRADLTRAERRPLVHPPTAPSHGTTR